MEAEANRNIELREFIPLASVDPVYFEEVYYLGAGKGSEKPYRLLTGAMARSGRVALAEMVIPDESGWRVKIQRASKSCTGVAINPLDLNTSDEISTR